MPLEPGSLREVVSENISEMMHSGHPQKQAVAAALREAGLSKYQKDASPAQPTEHKPGPPPGPEKEISVPQPEGHEMPGMPVPVTRDTLADVNRRNRDRYK